MPVVSLNASSSACHKPVLTGESLEQHRPAVAALCRHMLGPGPASEDAVQETLLRAWRRGHQFEGRAALGTWLHSIARNVCLDELVLTARGPRLVADLADVTDEAPPDALWTRGDAPTDDSADPAALVHHRESVRLACVVALRVLPPRQRAALVLCVVLRVRASEAASLMGVSTVSVNSLLQRARATLLAADATLDAVDPRLDDAQHELLTRYVAAFTTQDAEALVALALDEIGTARAEGSRLLAA